VEEMIPFVSSKETGVSSLEKAEEVILELAIKNMTGFSKNCEERTEQKLNLYGHTGNIEVGDLIDKIF